MVRKSVSRALSNPVTIVGVLLGLAAFTLPEFLASYELGLTTVLSLKIAGLLSFALVAATLIFKSLLDRQLRVIKKFIRVELERQRETPAIPTLPEAKIEAG